MREIVQYRKSGLLLAIYTTGQGDLFRTSEKKATLCVEPQSLIDYDERDVVEDDYFYESFNKTIRF